MIQDNTDLKLAIIQAGQWISSRHWVPATGGNFSARTGQNTCFVTASGRHKGVLTESDLLETSWHQSDLTCQGKPSAETLVHTQIYDLDQTVQVIFHTHSVNSTIFSRLIHQSSYCFNGYEMQKSISGNITHDADLILPIVDNQQDMKILASQIKKTWSELTMPYAFLVRGHGMYVWGKNIQQALQHLEGWEFLIECELKRIELLNKMHPLKN